jgi:hypothetical protein
VNENYLDPEEEEYYDDEDYGLDEEDQEEELEMEMMTGLSPNLLLRVAIA